MIIPEKLRSQDDYKACVNFHGHTCMGLTIGYLAAKLGMQYLLEHRALDEELVCISETDACCCDAIQVLTGCTFGKGNFIFKDIGKMAFSFISRTSGKGVRLSMRPGIMDAPEEERTLLEKIRAGEASPTEIKDYDNLHENRSNSLFEKGPEAFFAVAELKVSIPRKARITPSLLCESCRELVMKAKLLDIDGRKLCRSCSSHDL